MTYKVLMVCTGNICRSVMAQVVLAEKAEAKGLDLQVDSAGISAEEYGHPMDPRAASVLAHAGYEIPAHNARQITAQDLQDFDLILAMTSGHYGGIERLVQRSGPGNATAEIRMYRSFDPANLTGRDLDVSDPWYGDLEDFRETLQTVETVTPALLDYITHQQQPTSH